MACKPPPPGSDVAVTYRYSMDQQTVIPDGLLLNAPAVGLTATASDMAHFMIAQLEDGHYRDAQILQGTTLRYMQRQHFTYEAAQPGMTW